MNKRLHKKQVNHYLRVLAVQEIYYANDGRTNKWIYENAVKPRFITISRSTYFKYLAINAKGKLKELENEKNQAKTNQG
ncbi:hypothetical protein BDD43_3428 [Mucilaginibacter gracilis]|uniref:Uncharacterized protein n=1 Tax=Mucilaginibacter gracilis TaxID=423350 RepID=A0A495J2L9_9SPHI|nr:chitobiase/beta-hexosaminidase C-terminal domain-containing protein [Mucilaginibacter gracilis]RKR83225.1 hypothetical protein BDD43_3428 [Mucilaginibacter gracilis]